MLPANLMLISVLSLLGITNPTVKSGIITYRITTVGEVSSNVDSLTTFFNKEVKSMNLYLKGGVEIKTIRRYSINGNKFELYFLRNDLYEKIIDVEDWYSLDVGWPKVERLPASLNVLGYTCVKFLIKVGKETMLEIMTAADIEPSQKLYTGFDGIPLMIKAYGEKGYTVYEATEVRFDEKKDFDVEVKAYQETTLEAFMERHGAIDHFYKVFGFFVP